MILDNSKSPVLVGRPYDCTGRGEDVRCFFRSFRSAGAILPICENYKIETRRPDAEMEKEMGSYIVPKLSKTLNIFNMNGDEVVPTFSYFSDSMSPNSYNIIMPQWELSIYPAEWAKQLERFNEIWAPSKFVYDSLAKAVSKPVVHMPLATEIKLDSYLGRRYFNLPESAYLFLFYFDFRSYVHRKNPYGAIKAFEKVCAARPYDDIRLVLKINRPQGPSLWESDFPQFMNDMESYSCRDRITVIDKIFSDNETKNLVRCCDCFVSLHRSEGYGRGLSEAMFLGKPVIATAYSGNMDFMNKENSYLVPYSLIKLKSDEYPFAKGQVWAEPDIERAADLMLKLIDKPDAGRKIGEIASRHIRTYYSYQAIGLKYKKRIDEILRKILRTNIA